MGKRHKQFTEDDIDMANKHIKSCSISLTTRKMQMRTTRGYSYTRIRMVKITIVTTPDLGQDAESSGTVENSTTTLEKFGSFL